MRCTDCGCYMQNGICSNCQEELCIFVNQNEDLANSVEQVDDGFYSEVMRQYEELKEAGNAKN